MSATATETNAIMQAALNLADRGIPVFPCRPADKSPLVAGGFKAASIDPVKIIGWWSEWPNALVGMPTGQASGQDVLDVDIKDGKRGREWLEANADRIKPLRTPVVATWSGGVHVYFNYHPDARNTTDKIANGVDVRGTGGYVIRWDCHGFNVKNSDEKIADWPADLLAEILAAQGPGRGKSGGKSERKSKAPPPGVVNDREPADENAAAILTAACAKMNDQSLGGRHDRVLPATNHVASIVLDGRIGLNQAVAAIKAAMEGAEDGRRETKAGEVREALIGALWHRHDRRKAGGGADGSEFGARPIIHIKRGDVAGLADQAEHALLQGGINIYHRADQLVYVGAVPADGSGGQQADVLRALPMKEHALIEHLTSAAEWRRFDAREKKETPADAPVDVARTLMQRAGRWKHIRQLRGIITAPTLRPDGSLLDQPGYDAASGFIFDPRGTEFPTIGTPTRADAERAYSDLGALLSTFPFVGEADRAVALSAILTACIRRALPTAPLHGFSATAAGTGKSKLVDIAAVIATGRCAPVKAQGASEEETEKRLGSAILAGDQIVSLDNCTRDVDGAFLCQVLSQDVVSIRPLCTSDSRDMRTDVFVAATGNNLRFAGDMTRRALLCSLDAQCERPELREFDHDPVGLAREGRGRYAAAALTIILAYRASGQPANPVPLGSFEKWSAWVRDAIVWLGGADPCATIDGVRDADPLLASVQAVFAQWRTVLGNQRIALRGVIETAVKQDLVGYAHADFREALLAVAGDRGSVNTDRLGKWLGRTRGRVVDGQRLDQDGLSHGNRLWCLLPAK